MKRSREEREDQNESPVGELWDGDDFEQNGTANSSKHRRGDRKKSSRAEDKDHWSKDHERYKKPSDDAEDLEKASRRGRRKGDKDEAEKNRDKGREKEKHNNREKRRDNDKDRHRDNGKEKLREMDQDKERSRDRDRRNKKTHEEDYNAMDVAKHPAEGEHAKDRLAGVQASTLELEERILNMRGERSKKKSEGPSEVLAWVNRSRKLEERKNVEKEKALQLSKNFEEQDNVLEGESDEEDGQYNTYDLAGVKVLHGLDKVMEGGAVVLTLKDQNILADGDVNEDADMLENVEMGEQKRRDEAYKAAKKKTGIYDDKFNNDPGAEKKILPQYDDPAVDEGVTLDERGHFAGEAEKKLEELRRRIQGAHANNRVEDLNSSEKISSDYYSHEEMLQFRKPKKKKSLRKKEKLDVDALEAEAIAAGIGTGDLGSRNDGRRQAIREEQERSEAEIRKNAYQSAYAKADEASKSLRLEQTLPVRLEDEENPAFADDDEDLYKSLERARKLALKTQEEAASGPQAIALLATTSSSQAADDPNLTTGDSQENKVVFTEMEEFVWGLQLDEEALKPESEDVFMEEDEAPKVSEQEIKDEAGRWTEVQDTGKDENPASEDNEAIVPDDTIHEVAVGKGLSGALKLLKDRGTLKENIEWGGRNMDKKKSKLVGIIDNDASNDKFKDLRIERTDEFGRIMTPKEAFRMISHKFHGKGPGKMKQEKRMKQYQEELKLKQMKNSDTPSLSVERMREAQARLQTPYLVLSGHVKPGQISDPRSGFATVEKDIPGGLTPMLGDRKVEHFLGIKRKSETESMGTHKKPKA